jgi:hypothetical protein
MARLPLLIPPLALAACAQTQDANDIVYTVNSPEAADASGVTNAVDPADAAAAAMTPDADEHGAYGVCEFGAWSADPDPAGLHVRAAPSLNARIVDTLPPPVHDAENDMDYASNFSVVASRNGWFRIEDIQGSRDGQRDMHHPSGWIDGRYLGFDLQTDKVFAAPTRNSAVVATSWWDSKNGVVSIDYRNPTECKGRWIKLTVKRRDGSEAEAWSSGVCGNQDTTCDGNVGVMMDFSKEK